MLSIEFCLKKNWNVTFGVWISNKKTDQSSIDEIKSSRCI